LREMSANHVERRVPEKFSEIFDDGLFGRPARTVVDEVTRAAGDEGGAFADPGLD
jgi:hypothetical protein